MEEDIQSSEHPPAEVNSDVSHTHEPNTINLAHNSLFMFINVQSWILDGS